MEPPVISGYYRFTDVFFEWAKAIPNEDDRGPLKAMISHTALVHPEHPLREPGADGIKNLTASQRRSPAESLARCSPLPSWSSSNSGCSRWASRRSPSRCQPLIG